MVNRLAAVTAHLLQIAAAREAPTRTAVQPNSAISFAKRRHAPAPRLFCGTSRISNSSYVVIRSMPSSPILPCKRSDGSRLGSPFCAASFRSASRNLSMNVIVAGIACLAGTNVNRLSADVDAKNRVCGGADQTWFAQPFLSLPLGRRGDTCRPGRNGRRPPERPRMSPHRGTCGY
jgi:hypothetical protein